MARHDAGATMRDARAQYFAANGFGDGGYDERWVKLAAGPLAIYLPNTQARVRAVRFHDLHHVVTGYETTWVGEAEIAAWEIASSCADHHAAWLLNLQALAIGLVLDPQAMWRAFVRGRRTANLYREQFGDALLAETVDAMRRRLRLDRDPGEPAVADYVAFGAWSLAAVFTLLATVAVVLTPIVAAALLLR